jgi:hypothetical protein
MKCILIIVLLTISNIIYSQNSFRNNRYLKKHINHFIKMANLSYKLKGPFKIDNQHPLEIEINNSLFVELNVDCYFLILNQEGEQLLYINFNDKGILVEYILFQKDNIEILQFVESYFPKPILEGVRM